MIKYLRSVSLLICLLLSGYASAEQASPESIKALLKATGSGDLGVQVLNQMVPALKKMIPDAPETFWTDFMSEVDASDLEDLVVPIYQKYLTTSDIEEINRFYQTQAGKKMIRVQPAIMQESMAVGQLWGQELAQKVLMRYEQEKKK